MFSNKTFLPFFFTLLLLNAAVAQTSKTVFCTRLDSVLNFFTFSKPEIKGQQIRSDEFNTFYQSRVKFSRKGRVQISVSKKDSYLTFYTEWLGENLSDEKAGWIYDDYFSQFKNCLGEKFSEKETNTPESKWAMFYSADYVVALHLNKDTYTGFTAVSVSVYPPEQFDY